MKKRMLCGYSVVYVPEHFNTMRSDNWRGYAYEHRYVVEKALGRRLADDEVVHHRNGDKMDNKLENLEVLSRSGHAHKHLGRTPESHCEVCGRRLGDRRATMCVDCRAKKSRKVEWPSKEQLQSEMSFMSLAAIGRKYGVSDNAVRKWAKKYSLI